MGSVFGSALIVVLTFLTAGTAVAQGTAQLSGTVRDESGAGLIPVGAQRVELRLETFNLFDTFNWGNPVTNFNSGAFGRITAQAGDPRISPAT